MRRRRHSKLDFGSPASIGNRPGRAVEKGCISAPYPVRSMQNPEHLKRVTTQESRNSRANVGHVIHFTLPYHERFPPHSP